MLAQLTCKKQFLVTDDDLIEYQKTGLPVEVFCPVGCATVAFGLLEKCDATYAIVNGKHFPRDSVVFFG